jgi:hypothetical protein
VRYSTVFFASFDFAHLAGSLLGRWREIIQKTKSGSFQAAFAHPNLLLVLDSKLRIAKSIYGTSYTGRDLDLALKIASGESDWVGQHSEWLYAVLLFGGSLLCVALAYYLAQLTVLRRAMRQVQMASGHDCR